MKKIESQEIFWLMELLAKKIEERFVRVSDAYVHFVTYSGSASINGSLGTNLAMSNSISLENFIVAAESLRIKLTAKQAKAIFDYLDEN
jgi:hypothetical protein